MSGRGDAPLAQEKDAVTFLWDLDKTYLRTEFDSLRKVARIPFETATDKVHLPGVPDLIQGLRSHATARGGTPYVYFLSASPPQIGGAIREKLELDGVVYEGIQFKDQLGNLARGRWRTLREQVGYKLLALLTRRRTGPRAAREFLFGDDWESDPLIYSLYGDVLTDRVQQDVLGRVLSAVGVRSTSRRQILECAEELRGSAPRAVERIYINLERRTPPSRFRAYGARLAPTFNTLQAAASLYQLDCLDLDGVIRVARVIADDLDLHGHRLRNSIDDLTRRGHLHLTTRDRLVRRLAREGLAPLPAHEAKLRARLRAALSRFRRAHPGPRALDGADYELLLPQLESGGRPPPLKER